MSRKPHLLDLPEILFGLVEYLDAKDVIACSLVCKSFYDSFSPFVWKNVHLGLPPDDQAGVRDKVPFARFISFRSSKPTVQFQSPLSREYELLQSLQKNASWIRELTVHDHQSPRQLMLGQHCTMLESLSLQGVPFNFDFYTEYWKSLQSLLEQNAARLRSLTLLKWGTRRLLRRRIRNRLPYLRPPSLYPLGICAQHGSLRSLTLVSGRIGKRDLGAFWKLCKQLETLVLMDVYLPLRVSKGTLLSRKEADNDSDINGRNHGNANSDGTTCIPALNDRRYPQEPATFNKKFPRLRELTLSRLHHSQPSRQLSCIIAHCPLLQTLRWTLPYAAHFPTKEFCEWFVATTWPRLDSITVEGHVNYLSDDEYRTILLAASQPFKLLDLRLAGLESPTLDLLLRDHPKALTRMDLTMAKDFNSDLGNSVSSEWIQRVLESCSSLEQITAAIIHSHDIINGKPWSCLRLKIFKIMVNMEFEARPLVHGRARSRFTEADEKQCREVFWQLSQLKALKVLNMECYLPSLSAMKFPLPLELRVGLEQLNRLKHLEAIGYYGTQDIRMVDLEWMLEQWPCLKTVIGGRLSGKRSRTFGDHYVRDHLFMERLRSRNMSPVRLLSDSDRSLKLYILYRKCIVYDTDSESDDEKP